MTNPAFSPATTWRHTPHSVTFTHHLPTPSTATRVIVEAEHQAADAFSKAMQTRPSGSTTITGIGKVVIDGLKIEALRTKHRTIWRVNGKQEAKSTVEALAHLHWQAAIAEDVSEARDRRLAAVLDRYVSRQRSAS